ncbi:MAG: hypothetical protein OS112_05495 [Methanoregula sp.]|nr:MAG: hypothetical protein OS112_05495 [Methanoregula sp.]
MSEIRLSIRKRAFPSRGRVRLNVAHLPVLGILEGDHVDLINEDNNKTITTTVIADTMVQEGQIRVSDEDLKALGLKEGGGVLVRKTQPLEEKIKKAAADAGKSFSKGVSKLDNTVKKTAGEVKTGAAKAADTVKKETRKASDKVGSVAVKAVKGVKKTVNKATGSDDL